MKASSQEDKQLRYNSAGYAYSGTYSGSLDDDTTQLLKIPSLPALDSPEDIAAWIADRKRKWPTDARILQNKAQRGNLAKGPRSTVVLPGKSASRTSDLSPETTGVVQQSANPVKSSLDVALEAIGRQESDDQLCIQDSHSQTLASNEVEDLSGKQEARIESPRTADFTSQDGGNGDLSMEYDDKPEMTSSKDVHTAALPVTTEISLANVKQQKHRRACKYFKQGRCHKGENCGFDHTLSKEGKAPASKVNELSHLQDKHKWRKRKSLYERLLEGQEDGTARVDAEQSVVNNVVNKDA